MITPTLIYDCPCCGQGGLELVSIKTNPSIVAVACSECDRIWIPPCKVGVNNETDLEVVLSQLGLSGAWANIESIQQGVPWDHLDADYQTILMRKHEDSCSQPQRPCQSD